jgi:hypothetical protein
MTVKITKPSINVREKLSELDKETGIKGEELLRADTSAEAREALQLDQQLFTDFESTGIDDNATSTVLTVSDTGIDVTGTVTADGLVVNGAAVFNEGGGDNDFRVESDTNNQAFFVEGSSGKVGINTTDLSGIFNVKTGSDYTNLESVFQVQNGNYGLGLLFSTYFDAGTDTGGRFISKGIAGSRGGFRFTAANGYYTGFQDVFRVSPSGYVTLYDYLGTANSLWDAINKRLGIGTTSPAQMLHLSGTTPDIQYTDTTGSEYKLGNNNGVFRLYDVTAATERLRIDSSGNVGIGTTTTNGLKTAILGASGYPATSGTTQTGVFRISGGTGLYNVLDMGVNETTDTAWIQATRANTLSVYDKLVLNPYGGNVGIGTSSPSEALDVVGSARILRNTGATNTGDQNSIVAGATTSGSYNASYGAGLQFQITNSGGGYSGSRIVSRLNADNNTANLVFQSRNYGFSDSMTITSSGNVGIGTSSPTYKLNVLSAAGAQNIFQAGQSGVSNGLSITSDGSVLTYSFLTGNVGIGNTDPAGYSSRLLVDGGRLTIASGNRMGFWDAANLGRFEINSPSYHALAFYTDAGTERMRIDSSGQVGIGTSSPSTVLHVAGNSTGRNTIVSNVTIDGGSTVANPYDGFGFGIDFIGRDYGNAIRDYAYIYSVMETAGSSAGGGDAGFTAGLRFYTNGGGSSGATPTERMRIDASGNVGIGTSSPTYKLHVRSADASDDVAYIHHDNASQSSGTLLKVRSDAGAGSGYSLLDVQNNSGTALYVAGDNKVGIGTTSPSELLHVSGASSPAIRVTATNTPVSVSLQADDATGFLTTVTNHPLVFRTNSTERMRIDASGNAIVGGTSAQASDAVTLMADGEVTAAGFYFSNNIGAAMNSEGIRRPTTGAIAFDTASTERMRINSVGNVNIGRGANHTDNTARLAVFNSGASESYTIRPGTNVANQIDILSYNYGTNTYLPIRELASSWIWFSGTAGERARIDTSGNLLVGKTASDLGVTAGIELNGQYDVGYFTRSAEKALVVNRLSTDGTIAEFRKDGTTIGSIGSTAGSMYIEGNPATSKVGLTFFGSAIEPRDAGAASNGDVDLGASGSRFKDLYLSGTANVGSVNVDQNNAFTNTNITSANTNTDKGNFLRFMQVASGSIPAPDFFIGHAGDNSGDAVLRNASSSSMKFYTNNTEKARIDASGNLLVGRTSTITFSTNTTDGIVLSPSRIDISAASLCRISQLRDSTGTYDRFYNGASIVGSITGTTSATAYNTSSDQRLKENITDADDAGSKVDAIQVRQFDWKADGSHQDYGMVAQELMTVAPEAVSVPEDPEEMMGVDYSKLVPMLIKEIQSLRNRVATLEGN